jgi:hypothetical protein
MVSRLVCPLSCVPRQQSRTPIQARLELQWSIPAMIENISAITLATHNMSRAVCFYRMLGFEIVHGGDKASFTSFRVGNSYLNLIAQPTERNWSWWGRVIFYHSDVDSLHASVVAAGYRPDTAPHDAEWASGSSTSPTRMVTNLASLGRCDSVRPMTPWHRRKRACEIVMQIPKMMTKRP